MIGRTVFSRRAVLLATAAAPLAAACTTPPPPPPQPDPLAELVQAARSDAALAAAVGAPETAAARTEHATRLQAEVDRATPRLPGSSTAPTSTSVAPPAGASREALVPALQAAQKQAAGLVASVEAHRVGLVASVAAGCASLVEALS